jgi:hypothetical protein
MSFEITHAGWPDTHSNPAECWSVSWLPRRTSNQGQFRGLPAGLVVISSTSILPGLSNFKAPVWYMIAINSVNSVR